MVDFQLASQGLHLSRGLGVFFLTVVGKIHLDSGVFKTQSGEESSSSGRFKRRVLKALEIQQRRPMMNLDAGLL